MQETVETMEKECKTGEDSLLDYMSSWAQSNNL